MEENQQNKDATTTTASPQTTPPRSPKIDRIDRSKLPRKARQFSKQQLLDSMKKKRRCNAKAQTVVMKMIDKIDTPDELVAMLKDINQCHFQDIIEERSITRLCGYPLCREELANIPKQQYHISVNENKVYDLTERKHFCSGACFKAATFVKEQMLTSPLWLRDQEDIPEFKLLSLD